MGNFLSRGLLLFLLLGASAESLNAVVLSVTIYNNSEVSIVNPVLHRGTYPAQGGGSSVTWGLTPNQTIAPGGSYTYNISSTSTFWTSTTHPHIWAVDVNGTPVTESIDWFNAAPAAGAYFLTFGESEPEACWQIITLQNIGLRMIRGYWALNGIIEYTEDIPPGEDRTHTITPEDCEDAEITAWTVTLMLNEDLELVPSTNVWDTIIDPETVGTNSLPVWWQQPHVPSIEPGWILTNELGNFNPPIQFTPGADAPTSIQEGFTGLITDNRAQYGQMIELLSRIQENTLGTKTNLDGNVVSLSEMQSGAGAGVGWSNAVAAEAAEVTLSSSIGGSVPDLTVSLAGHSVDLNPFHNSTIATAAAGIKAFITWAANILWCVLAFKTVRGLLTPVLLAPQASAASATPVASSASALVMAGVIVAIVGSVVLSLVTYITAHTLWTAAMSSPFTGVVGNAAAFLENICPVSHLIALLVAWFVFQIAAMSLAAGAALVVRFFVGCFVGALLQVNAPAATVDLINATRTNITFGALHVPPGQTMRIEIEGAFSASDGSSSVPVTLDASPFVIERVLVFDTGTGVAVDQKTVDVLEGFWLGMAAGAGLWSLGVMRTWLLKATRGGGE